MSQAIQSARQVLGFALVLSALSCVATTWDGLDLPDKVAWYPEIILGAAADAYSGNPVPPLLVAGALGIVGGVVLVGFKQTAAKTIETWVLAASFAVPLGAVDVSFGWWYGDGFPWWIGDVPATLGVPAVPPGNWPDWVLAPVAFVAVVGAFTLYLVVMLGSVYVIAATWDRIRGKQIAG
ncbi:MAG: hypothetical protein OXI54_03830 [Chloroflexota bacterium]|nr:hypothetical protein [Chloroflexota bacterium]MDE2683261.1 hypothetical protein [Chloroflexota bacterium]